MAALNRGVVVGLIAWALILIALITVGRGVYTLILPPSVLLAVSPQFPESRGLTIEGKAFVGGEPAAAGRVKLEIRRMLISPVRITILEDIKDGLFAVTNPGHLSVFKKDDWLVIKAVAQIQRGGSTITGEEYAFWNVGDWINWLPWVLVSFSVLLAVGLSILFTGPFSGWKNRCAISITYLAITLFLIAPFVLLPILVKVIPNLAEAMVTSPVGFVKVHKANNRDVNQWSLNIGGIPKEFDDGSFDIENGLVIPLYVMVLAVLGGVINMTRKVPALQSDLDASLPTRVKALESIGPILRLQARETPSAHNPENDTETEGEAAAANGRRSSPQQAEVNKKRGELISQYLYLITAPVLAIVMYYLLGIVNESLAVSIPIVVLISFASGLMSESVLGTITFYIDKSLKDLREGDGGRGNGGSDKVNGHPGDSRETDRGGKSSERKETPTSEKQTSAEGND